MTAIRALLVIVLGVGTAAEATDEDLWTTLATPGTVILVRHSNAPGSLFDPPGTRIDDCSTQRNLDADGRAHATRLGEAFRARAIEVGAVLSSPSCRCLDTGRLAFGRVEVWEPLSAAFNDPRLRRRQVQEIQERIAAYIEGPPLVLITHGNIIGDLTGITNVRMGELVVLPIASDGRHPVAGRLYIE
jgi:phosphohistidine phosphatase SixA